MNRAEWQNIAESKLLAAGALLAASRWPSAYYLAGYAIECGLKSCVLARLAVFPEVIFEKKTFSEKCWTHDIENLVDLAGLKPGRDTAKIANPVLALNWLIAGQWNEAARYQMKTQPEAEALYRAIADPVSGVMQWIRDRW